MSSMLRGTRLELNFCHINRLATSLLEPFRTGSLTITFGLQRGADGLAEAVLGRGVSPLEPGQVG